MSRVTRGLSEVRVCHASQGRPILSRGYSTALDVVGTGRGRKWGRNWDMGRDWGRNLDMGRDMN